jgi:hypothetical protein
VNGSYLFIESSDFTLNVKHYFGSDDGYADFQTALARNPDQGDVIRGGSPLRKLRWGDHRRGKGKRGGLRVIYIHVPEHRVLFLLDVYDKDEADDLTREERKELQALALRLVEELNRRFETGRK